MLSFKKLKALRRRKGPPKPTASFVAGPNNAVSQTFIHTATGTVIQDGRDAQRVVQDATEGGGDAGAVDAGTHSCDHCDHDARPPTGSDSLFPLPEDDAHTLDFEPEPRPESAIDEDEDLADPGTSRRTQDETDYKSPHWNSDTLMDMYMENERRSSDVCGRCGEGASHRCRDCFGDLVLCRDCLRDEHARVPFHHLEEWADGFWRRASLRDLGLALYCGHRGRRCPNTGDDLRHKVQIIHEDGSFSYDVYECACHGAPPFWKQLFSMKLFPATFDRPRTAFTFSCLKNFQTLNFSAKTSLWDYFEAIRRKTDGVSPASVPNSYNQLRDVSRQWRFIRTMKRSGKLHSRELGFGSLCVCCVCCAREGVNLKENWKEDPLGPLINAKMWAVDANFQVNRHRKGGDVHADPSLFRDYAYWAVQGFADDYMEYWENAKYAKKTNLKTCSSFKAGDPTRAPPQGNKDETGIVSCCCARHMVVQPNAVADLHHGERYANVDLPVATVFRRAHPCQRHVLCYNINCMYKVNFANRVFEGGLLELSEIPTDISWLLPAWHGMIHIPGCLVMHGIRYCEHTGRTCGEGQETIWAKLNNYRTSTREMSGGHRRETLTDVINDHNFRKNVAAGRRIHREYIAALSELAKKEEALAEIENNLTPETLRFFQKDSASRGGEKYKPLERKGLSKVAVLKKLTDAELSSTSYAAVLEGEGSTRGKVTSQALFVCSAMDLEDIQDRLRRSKDLAKGTDSQKKEHIRLRSEVDKRLATHFQAYVEICSSIGTVTGYRAGQLEDQKLWLPSDLDEAQRSQLGLDGLASVESSLRIGQAHEALGQVRDFLGLKDSLVGSKRAHVRGYEAVTRSEESIRKAEKLLKQSVAAYKRAYSALTSLGCEFGVGTEAGPLAELDDSCLKPLSHWTQDGRYNISELPWIWRITAQAGASTSEESWASEVARLEWLHASASRDRWWEEHVLLYEELRRVGLSFRFEQRRWDQRACWEGWDGTPDATIAGVQAHAKRMASQCHRLAEEAERRFRILELSAPPYDKKISAGAKRAEELN